MCVCYTPLKARAVSTEILVAIFSVGQSQSDHHHLQSYCLNLGWVEPEHWNVLYIRSAIVDVVPVKLFHGIPHPLLTTSHRNSSVSPSIISSGIWFGFSRLAFLLTYSKACPFCMAVQCVLSMYNFCFVCPCPSAHINCSRVSDMKYDVFMSWQMVCIMGMQATSGKVVCVMVYCQTLRLLPLCIFGYLYTQLSKCRGLVVHLLCQHIQTMTKKWLFQCCNMCSDIANIGMAAYTFNVSICKNVGHLKVKALLCVSFFLTSSSINWTAGSSIFFRFVNSLLSALANIIILPDWGI